MKDIKKFADFYKSVICGSKQFNSSFPVKDLELLYPEFKNRLIKSINQFISKYPGVPVYISETYRGLDLQKQYYKNGSSKTLNSVHRLGLAADVDIPIKYYPALRNIFVNNGLYILGKWDLRHVQYIPVSMQGKVWDSIKNICSNKYREEAYLKDESSKNIISYESKTYSSVNLIIVFVALGIIVTIILKKYG